MKPKTSIEIINEARKDLMFAKKRLNVLANKLKDDNEWDFLVDEDTARDFALYLIGRFGHREYYAHNQTYNTNEIIKFIADALENYLDQEATT